MFEEMEDNERNTTEATQHSTRETERFAIEDDSDTLEPLDQREINADDEKDLRCWAEQCQVSPDLLKGAIALNGDSVVKIKEYLSV